MNTLFLAWTPVATWEIEPPREAALKRGNPMTNQM
jgi:hypothetical protein